MNNIDRIHDITSFPLAQKFFNDRKSFGYVSDTGPMDDFIQNLSEIELEYFNYCINAYQYIESRDYHLLRKVLQKNVYNNRVMLGKIINQFFDFYSTPITNIYDIGAGHSSWGLILHNVFPNAEITLIDKEDIALTTDFGKVENMYFLKRDILEWVKRFKNCGSHALLFLSEFVHCKDKNLELLKYDKINQCNVIINELDLSTISGQFINKRLEMTGGKLIDGPEQLSKYMKLDKVVYYKTMFDYFISFHKSE